MEEQQVPPMRSCNKQVAILGGTSCTVHNYPNNNGNVSYSRSEKLLVLGFTAILVVSVMLYSLCRRWIGARRATPVQTIPPVKMTKTTGTGMSDTIEIV